MVLLLWDVVYGLMDAAWREAVLGAGGGGEDRCRLPLLAPPSDSPSTDYCQQQCGCRTRVTRSSHWY